MDRFHGMLKYSSDLRNVSVKRACLFLWFSANKTVSKIATGEAKPNNQIEISSGHEKAFDAFICSKIPMVGLRPTSLQQVRKINLGMSVGLWNA